VTHRFWPTATPAAKSIDFRYSAAPPTLSRAAALAAFAGLRVESWVVELPCYINCQPFVEI
jgi:hypothetical protein